jgi:ubiquinone/menaquinone biosynthesis C-methylase UbiE
MATRQSIGGRLPQFFEYYGRKPSRAERAIEREVFGGGWGISSYTTAEQAETLAEALGVGPGHRVLDIGSGTGWPGLYLADRTGCRTVLTDVPRGAIRSAAGNAYRRGLATRCGFAVASGEHLPFRPGTFDAVLHSDVL